MKNIIKAIGDKVIEELYNFGGNEYRVEFDDETRKTEVYMRFNGDYHKQFFFNGSIKVVNGCLDFVEVFDYDDVRTNIANAVGEYVEKEIEAKDWFAEARRANDEFYMDDYQRNGFAGEADFWQYKLGA